MLDIHAHLFWDSYGIDRDEVIKRAQETGVKKMICVGTSPKDNPQAIAVAEKYDGIFASVGLHPHFFNEFVEEELQISNFKFQNNLQNQKSKIQNQPEKKDINKIIAELRSVAQSSKKTVALGECGLDYYSRDEQSVSSQQKAIQREGFLAQIGLAEELRLPLIIHTRPSIGSQDAYEDMFDILRNEFLKTKSYPPASEAGKPKAILHCYQGDTEITKKFLALPDVYFSFAGTITYPVKPSTVGTKDDPIETVKLVPLERMFVETDCPFLAPQDKRGERNEPAYVRMTTERVCAVRGATMATLESALDENFRQVFVFHKA